MAEAEFEKGLEDDLNTAVALAAIFDLVRDVNTVIDRGQFRQGDAPVVLAAVEKFDHIFALLTDDDAEKLRAMGFEAGKAELSDAEVEALIAQRQEKLRKFALRVLDSSKPRVITLEVDAV
jgi:cysteinyl-tRNA synthetase